MSNQTIANDKSIPYQAYDLFAIKEGEDPLVIELKSLKTAKKKGAFVVGGAQNKARLLNDFGRLRNARERCHRVLVVAVHPKVSNALDLMNTFVKLELDELRACDVSGGFKVWAFHLKGHKP